MIIIVFVFVYQNHITHIHIQYVVLYIQYTDLITIIYKHEYNVVLFITEDS